MPGPNMLDDSEIKILSEKIVDHIKGLCGRPVSFAKLPRTEIKRNMCVVGSKFSDGDWEEAWRLAAEVPGIVSAGSGMLKMKTSKSTIKETSHPSIGQVEETAAAAKLLVEAHGSISAQDIWRMCAEQIGAGYLITGSTARGHVMRSAGKGDGAIVRGGDNCYILKYPNRSKVTVVKEEPKASPVSTMQLELSPGSEMTFTNVTAEGEIQGGGSVVLNFTEVRVRPKN